MKSRNKNIIVIILFSIAMAALESAVVVYLRALYYPDDFTVAFKLVDEKIVLIEIIREAATLCMIWSIGYLTSKTRYERLPYFLLCFAVWDIFYYVWLKIFLDWPASLFDWDILFLIPFTWLGPVLSPVICSLTMIILAAVLLRSKHEIKISKTSIGLLVSGSLLILYTYLFDYGNLLLTNDLLSDYANLLQNKKFTTLASAYVPVKYNWGIFWVGELLIISAIINLCIKTNPLHLQTTQSLHVT
jgi:hypothetical protein